jgi:hypothetical protein
MEPQSSKSDLDVLADALCDIRDSWMQISMVLKDHVADSPPPLRDEVAMLVERQSARLREGARGNFE